MIKNFPHTSNRLKKKNSGLLRGLKPWPRDTIAMLYQLSYEATDVGSRSIVGSYVPVKEMSVKDIWNKSYMNYGSPEFFSGFFTQLHKLRSLRRSFLHFQNSEYRSNDVNNPWTWCTRWTKRWPTFWHENQCPTGRASFWVKFPNVRKNARGMPGEWEVLELTGK